MNKVEMTPQNTAMLRIYLQDVDMGQVEDPHILYRALCPNAVRREWVPQSIGDQIWLFFTFSEKNERDDFISGLPENLARCIEKKLDQKYLAYT